MNKQKFVDYTARPVLSVAALALMAVPLAATSGTYASDPVSSASAKAPTTMSIQAPASESAVAASVEKAVASTGTLSEKKIKEIAAKLDVDEGTVRAVAGKSGASVQGPGVSVVTVSSKTKLITGYNGALPADAIVAPAQPVIVLDGGQYGWRLAPDAVGGGKLEFHNGTDIAAPAGTPVVSALPEGTVTAVFFDVWGGNRVEVTHANGIKTTYSHLLEVNVHKGDRLALGEQLGSVGATGTRVTGPHLHFEVWVDGQHVDPQRFDWVTDARTIPAVNDGYQLSKTTPPTDLDGIPTAPTGEEIKKAAQKAAAQKKAATAKKTQTEKVAAEKAAAAKKAASDKAETKKTAAKTKAPSSAPAKSAPAPVKVTPKPVKETPAPVQVTPKPVTATPAPAPAQPKPAAPVATPAPSPTTTPSPAPSPTATPAPTPSPSASAPAAPAAAAGWTTPEQEAKLRKLHASATVDTDGDGIVDALDEDIDGDGIANWLDDDLDGDGILNTAEPAAEVWVMKIG